MTWPLVRGARDQTLIGLGLSGALAIGVLATHSALAATAVLLAGAALVLAVKRPVILFAGALTLIAIEPERLFGAGSFAGRPETFKLLLYACAIPLLFDRGVDRRRTAPLFAYCTVAVTSTVLGTRLAGLTTGQTLASLATLCLPWLVFTVRWRFERDRLLLKVLALVPLLSVLIAVALQSAGVLHVLRDSSPPRLQGATIAAWLGALGLYGAMACMVLWRRERWRAARWLALGNVAILCATLTRGAIIALCIGSLPFVFRFIRSSVAQRGAAAPVKLTLALVVLIGGIAVAAPGVLARDENAKAYVPGQGASHEIASGRLEAWTFAYEQAKANIAFGRGIGAGPLIGQSPGSPIGFTAQHDEYVRMLLEGGILGVIVLLAAMVATFSGVIRRAPRLMRADLAAAAIAFAVYAITENTLSATPLAVAFMVVFSLAASPALEAEARGR